MKQYQVLKPLYNARKGRVLSVGELIEFDDQQAAVLMERGIIRAISEPEVQRYKRRGGRNRDHELDKLTDNL